MSADNDFWQSDDRSKGRRVPVYGGPRRKSPPSSKVRAAAGVSEAVVKVGKFYTTKSRVRQALEYQSRGGTLDVELKDGTVLTPEDGLKALKDLSEQWSTSFSDRKKARNAVHIILSTPKGSDQSAVLEAARTWGQRVLGKDYDFAFTLHTDEPHPHVHFVVVREGLKGRRLGWSRAELDGFRAEFAAIARQKGVELNATRRDERGVSERPEPQPVRKARARLGSSMSDVGAAREVLAGLSSGADGEEAVWMASMKAKFAEERAEYEALAGLLKRISGRMGEDQDGVVASTAGLLARQSMAMRTIITRRGQMEKIAKATKLAEVSDRDAASETLAKLYRAERNDRGERSKVVAPAKTADIVKQLEAFEASRNQAIGSLIESGDRDAAGFKDGVERLIERQKDVER